MGTNRRYSVGDLVQLKSGGPVMTVQKENLVGRDEIFKGYYCQWFAGKKLELGPFPEDSLEVATEEPKKK